MLLSIELDTSFHSLTVDCLSNGNSTKKASINKKNNKCQLLVSFKRYFYNNDWSAVSWLKTYLPQRVLGASFSLSWMQIWVSYYFETLRIIRSIGFLFKILSSLLLDLFFFYNTCFYYCHNAICFITYGVK